MTQELAAIINKAWDERDTLSVRTQGAIRDAVDTALAGLDNGKFRVAEPVGDGVWPNKKWKVNQWLKKAVLLGFRLNPMQPISGGHGGSLWWDKVAPKFYGWTT
ncbi:MAG: 2,3,4,5-tetrahydropyridine-2,6-dicarboxylate N-succinyltransferase, partial [Robiginitomaculum sp.]|nr:2,3,4,5-tetrahydropyridine-2,6-dicarboxylate N-succinyltransferase [Robiginitomaculum sp.]